MRWSVCNSCLPERIENRFSSARTSPRVSKVYTHFTKHNQMSSNGFGFGAVGFDRRSQLRNCASEMWEKGGLLELYEAVSKSFVETASKAQNGGLRRFTSL